LLLIPKRRRTLVIESPLADEIIAQADKHAPLETGGILLGHPGDQDALARVVELVAAGPQARRRRHRFAPDGPWQRDEVASRYRESGRRLHYLGDWHSHPTGNGPSRLDHETARRIAAERAARCAHPIFLIAVRDRDDWDLRAYRLARRRFRKLAVER
jgi:integrative and conjugative element protein (TIGR02256 family)